VKFNLAAFRPVLTGFLVVVALAITGAAVRPFEEPAWQFVKSKQPALKLDSLQGALGQGVTVGLLGGFRAIVADFFWIKTNAVWEDNDLPKTQTFIKLVTAIDPRPLYFWQNGSRMIAYDMPNWRIMEEGGYDTVPQVRQRKIDEEQSAVALNYLNEAFGHHPDAPLLHVEIANVYLNRLKDTASAAEAYRRAALQPDAPYYAGRIYAELLRRLGRNAEAYAWLKQLYTTLPKAPDPTKNITPYQVDTAMAPVVLERIRELEGELNVHEVQAFRP
jgi:tetratricopeptide (TPR) repeat protein